ncbi:D-2-hydroxyacid dehydrogenase [Hyphomonas adhaerens]
MAEWALWAALDFLREGPQHRAQQDAAEWKRVRSREIAGSRWLIVGYGSIGEAVGNRVTALGGHVTGLRRSPGPAPGAEEILPSSVLPDALPDADVVLLCVPHTAETEGMAGADFFSKMKPDALFMNLGRGALVDEDALVDALVKGRPAYAALDVTGVEPLPAESPLWHHPKIMITPHDSSQTNGTILRADGTFVDNLHRYLNGEPLRNLVDRKAFED